jgi:hypothetical protein
MALVDQIVLSSAQRNNLTSFASRYGQVALLHVTSTMFAKSIADAHWTIRDLFRSSGFHDYTKQEVGPSNKVLKHCTMIQGSMETRTEISLYRPQTKHGDPRLWIYSLQQFAMAGDTLALAVINGALYVGNLNGIPIPAPSMLLGGDAAPWASKEARELLERVAHLASIGPILQIGTHDPSVGVSIEHALGIDQNSSKLPDYLGTVEIKAARTNRPSSATARKQLFAQVPDWSLSECKSIRSFLTAYGYERNGVRRLTCTVDAKRPNSQGLLLQLADSGESLVEFHKPTMAPALKWELSTLQRRLEDKHHETFWVRMDECLLKGKPAFNILGIDHTGPPASQLFGALVAEGQITLDHLIKDSPRGVTERGPSFKVTPAGHEVLFPIRARYNLSE